MNNERYALEKIEACEFRGYPNHTGPGVRCDRGAWGFTGGRCQAEGKKNPPESFCRLQRQTTQVG